MDVVYGHYEIHFLRGYEPDVAKAREFLYYASQKYNGFEGWNLEGHKLSNNCVCVKYNGTDDLKWVLDCANAINAKKVLAKLVVDQSEYDGTYRYSNCVIIDGRYKVAPDYPDIASSPNEFFNDDFFDKYETKRCKKNLAVRLFKFILCMGGGETFVD